MKGNIEEAKLYVKKRRDEFLKEVDNSKEYQQFLHPQPLAIRYKEIAVLKIKGLLNEFDIEEHDH